MTYNSRRILSLCLFLMLQGCTEPHEFAPTDNSTRITGRNDLLSELKRCLVELGAKNNEHFVSPCVKMDVATLSGISIVQLEAALGKPDISSEDYVAVPDHPNRSELKPPYEARWGFYRYPINSVSVTIGAGPELQCVSPDRLICKQVLWVHTQPGAQRNRMQSPL